MPTTPTKVQTSKKLPKGYDRYIPIRPSDEQHQEVHQNLISSCIKDANHLNEMPDDKILSFKNKAPEGTHKVLTQGPVSLAIHSTKKAARFIPSTSESCLDAPSLKMDFYLNLIDWSVDNTVAIALGPDVFLWNAESASISQLATRAKADWTSVSWASRGFYLALGTQQGEIEIHDTGVGKKLRTMIVGDARVPVCHWSTTTPHLVASACGSEVCISDVRARNHHVGTLTNGHEQEVIGLKWAPSGNQIATGGNDNRVCIWDVSSSLHTSPKHILRNHCAGVKAVAWCPWQSDLLATGGGNADRTIRFWNSSTGIQLNTIDTNSQISSLQWSKNPACKEIVSAHGYSKCELNVWQYPSLVKAAELHGHQERILSSCVSLDGTTVCTAGADETIRFWNIWPAKVHQKKKNEEASKLMKMLR